MTFNPDRFIASEGKAAERDPRELSFGFGRRFVAPTLFTVYIRLLSRASLAESVQVSATCHFPFMTN